MRRSARSRTAASSCRSSAGRRAGISLNGNYTWSRCFGLEMPTGAQFGIGFVDPSHPDYDRGHCHQDRTHLANVTVGAQTPEFGHAALRAVASNWRISGILNARSGSWLTVTSGRDNAFNGMANQRVDQVSDDVYRPKTLTNYLNPAAFAQPAAGTFGTHQRNSIKGPGFHKVDLALSRLVSLAATRTVEPGWRCSTCSTPSTGGCRTRILCRGRSGGSRP